MTPPDLPGDAPVLNVSHPAEIVVLPGLGNDPDPTIFDRLNRRFRERLDFDEPLVRQQRFDNSLAAVAFAERHLMGLGFFKQALIRQQLFDLLKEHKKVKN